jgi:hypothetical protein
VSKQYDPTKLGQIGMLIGGIQTLARLNINAPPHTLPANSIALTSDSGLCYSDGTTWLTIGSGSTSITALTGDVTASGTGSVAATIAAAAVTLAKQANFAASSLQGNPTGSPAAPSAVTLGTNLSFAGSVLNAAGGSGFTAGGDLSGTSSSQTIVAGAVTLAKQANFAASSLQGNATGSPAAPEAITLGTNLSFSGTVLNAASGVASLSSVSATLGTGPLNDLGTASDALAVAGWVGGTTNRLLLTPASGGSTVNGLLATGVSDGFVIPIFNQSLTDSLIFAHLAAGSTAANRFSNQAAGPYTIEPGAAATLRRVGTLWRFL